MMELWEGLTDAQASLLSTALLVLAGGIGVIFSAMIFGGRVKDLETALAATQGKIDQTLSQSSKKVEAFNQQLSERLSSVDDQFSAALDALGQLRNSVAGLQDKADETASDLREQFSGHWYAIQEAIEAIASDSKIHGKTRARYSKIPRRTLGPLLSTLIEEQRVEPTSVPAFKDALALWDFHKNGKSQTFGQTQVDQMREFAIRLIPGYRG